MFLQMQRSGMVTTGLRLIDKRIVEFVYYNYFVYLNIKNMKKLFVIASLIIGAAGCSNNDSKKSETTASADSSMAATPVAAADVKKEEPAEVPMDSASMMKAWQAYMTP